MSVAGMIRKKSQGSQFSKSPRTSAVSVNYSNTAESQLEGRDRRAVSCDSNTNKYTYTSYSTYTASLASRRMTATVKASNKTAILSVGEELRVLLHEEDPPLIKDRRFHLRTYPKSFVGSEMVTWLLKKGEVESRKEAVAMMQKLIDYGVVHHVCDDHSFKDEFLFYRFRKDDKTYLEPPDTAILAKGQRLYSRLKGDESNLIQDRRYHLSSFKQCFIGKEFVGWLLAKGEASSRSNAVDIGKHLLDAGVINHVCNDHHFKDELLFYRFKNDDKVNPSKSKARDRLRSKGSSKRTPQGEEDDSGSIGSSGNRGSGSSWDSASDTQRTTPELEEYVQMLGQQKQPSPNLPSVTPFSQSPQSSPPTPLFTTGDVRSNGVSVTPPPSRTGKPSIASPSIEELSASDGPWCKKEVNVVSDPVGYGFVIRGSRPIYVHSVDPNGPAASAGLKEGVYIYSVNGQNVLNASHTDAARIILMGTSTAALVILVPKQTH